MRFPRVTTPERNQLWNQVDNATYDAHQGHRHNVPVDHDLLRRLLRRLEALEELTERRPK